MWAIWTHNGQSRWLGEGIRIPHLFVRGTGGISESGRMPLKKREARQETETHQAWRVDDRRKEDQETGCRSICWIVTDAQGPAGYGQGFCLAEFGLDNRVEPSLSIPLRIVCGCSRPQW